MDLFHLWGVGCDCIEDVDKDEEEGDEEGHPAGDHVHRDEEGDPRHNDKQTWGEFCVISWESVDDGGK